MSNELSTEVNMSQSQIDILRNVVCKNATDAELKFFCLVCAAKKLDPFGQQIYLVKRKSKDGDTLAIQTSIDGFRSQAERTGLYAGNDEPQFFYRSPEDAQVERNPIKAVCKVWRLVDGVRVAFEGTARWSEFYPGDALGFMWRSKPHVMLGKCAEAQALRKAFPQQCGGMYEPAELPPQDAQNSILPAATAAPAIAQTAASLTAKFGAKPKPAATLPPAAAQKATPVLAPTHSMEQMVAAFANHGINPEAIAQYVGKSVRDKPTVADMEKLKVWLKEIEEAAGFAAEVNE